jgi:hypothetical protein
MSRHAVALALALSLPCALAAALAPEARAQTMGNFSWMPPAKVEEAMKKELRPGIYVFTVPGEAAAMSMDFQFTQPAVIEALGKYGFACCKIAITDQKSTRPWGAYQKLADEFGVSSTSALVLVAHDRKVMGLLSQVLKRDEFVVYLNKQGADHKKRIKISEDANTDLNQVEKWIEEKRWADAVRRMKTVFDKEKKLVASVVERMKELDKQLEEGGRARLAEGKAALDAGNKEEGKKILDEVTKAFAPRGYECAKEAAELLKGAK